MKVGSKVRVIGIPEDDPLVSQYLRSFLGRVGTITTEPDTSGGQWVQFSEARYDGGIFEDRELEYV